ncbi:MAG: NTP transferase domain-containing protein [Wenzhouxiangella sp.]|jgi:molybdopterin-guanine dinucleotide biosynthesis protein A|nr:NTP transferase domain-containing protein [Wenzhouxiangella sp.]
MQNKSAEHGESIDCIVLAGDRKSGDPLAAAAGVSGKALVPVADKPMLQHVLSTLASWPGGGRLVLVAPDLSAYRAIAAAAWPESRTQELLWIPPAASLVDSVSKALQMCRSQRCLLLTADHVLLSTAWLDELIGQSSESGAALALGLADWHAVMERFPGSRRTRYRFSDLSACGTNLFFLKDRQATHRVLALWRQVEQERKKPWRIVSLLGYRNLALYLTGRLRLAEAFAALSERVGAELLPVLIRDPLAAVDVDSPQDLALVEQVLADRERSGC